MKPYPIRKPLIISAVLAALCLAFVASFSSCGPDEQPDVRYGPFTLTPYKDYFYFKPGSYWIYENSVTHEYDTLTMETIDTFVVTIKSDYHRKTRNFTYVTFTDITMHLREGYDPRNYVEYYFTSFNPDAAVITHKYDLTRNRSGVNLKNFGEIIAFLYPFDIRSTYGGYGKFLTTLDTLTVGGKLFENVQVIDAGNDPAMREDPSAPEFNDNIYSYLNSEYHWCAKYGLIKVRSYYTRKGDPTIRIANWNLIKYNLIQ